MSDYMDNNETFDWGSEIEVDGQEFVTIEPGDYIFTVTGVERKQFKGSDKIPPCNQVVVKMEVETQKGKANVFENLYLAKVNEWRLSAFFRCLGMKKHGEKLKMDFPGAVGRKGYATFGTRKYNGEYYNTLVKYYDYDPAKINGGFKEVKGDDIPW